MFDITLICMGKLKEKFYTAAAAEYEKRVEDGISSLVSIIEPSLVAILSIVIGAALILGKKWIVARFEGVH